jgi:hypothetical protein
MKSPASDLYNTIAIKGGILSNGRINLEDLYLYHLGVILSFHSKCQSLRFIYHQKSLLRFNALFMEVLIASIPSRAVELLSFGQHG